MNIRLDYKVVAKIILGIAMDDDFYLLISDDCTELYCMEKDKVRRKAFGYNYSTTHGCFDADKLIDTIAIGTSDELAKLKEYMENQAIELRDKALDCATRCCVSETAFYKNDDSENNTITW